QVTGVLTGASTAWRFAGSGSVADVAVGSYGLARLSGPVEVAQGKTGLAIKAKLAGAGGRGAGGGRGGRGGVAARGVEGGGGGGRWRKARPDWRSRRSSPGPAGAARGSPRRSWAARPPPTSRASG